MKQPVATYRLQFRNGMDFDRATELVPYLTDLGISHLYASPIFTATAGSTHGYDVADHNEIDPTLGGRAGFDKLSAALRKAGIGLILDIVPNHMAASADNPWWRSVIVDGPASPFAAHFDIDWSRRLTLPILDGGFRELVAKGEIGLGTDAGTGRPAFTYWDQTFPLSQSQELPADMASLATDPAAMEELHSRQHFELIHWKEARRNLSYRRFFEVTGLVGVRVEDPAVFDDVHRLTLELVGAGQVDGLRIDHVDGLADPGPYLHRLRTHIGPDIYLIVEKILASDERCPPSWPIHGTTGYEFIDALGDVFVDETAQPTKQPEEYENDLRAAKRQVLVHNFDGELTRLAAMVAQATGNEPDTLRDVLAALIVELPVYRIYRDDDTARDMGRNLVLRAATTSLARNPAISKKAMDAVCGVLLAENETIASKAACRLFGQLTGPATAKGVEDTLFYRRNAFLALNEVGCEPARPRHPDRFHRRMIDRARYEPASLNATATHDTKRGEDARARLFAIMENRTEWNELSRGWRDMLSLPADCSLSAETDSLIFQSLAGVWPDDPQAPSQEAISDLLERFLPFLEKALREAKQETSWLEPNTAFEATAKQYVVAMLSPDNRSFHDAFSGFIASVAPAARINSLVQLVMKTTAPSIPDIYQGSEAGDFSLVDPDNRRTPQFAELAERLHRGRAQDFAATKQRLLAQLLRLRRQHADVFAQGSYVPLTATGPYARHLLAFLRIHRRQAALIAVPRLTRQLPKDIVSAWQSTTVTLPADMRGRTFSGPAGATLQIGPHVSASALMPGGFPGIWITA